MKKSELIKDLKSDIEYLDSIRLELVKQNVEQAAALVKLTEELDMWQRKFDALFTQKADELILELLERKKRDELSNRD